MVRNHIEKILWSDVKWSVFTAVMHSNAYTIWPITVQVWKTMNCLFGCKISIAGRSVFQTSSSKAFSTVFAPIHFSIQCIPMWFLTHGKGLPECSPAAPDADRSIQPVRHPIKTTLPEIYCFNPIPQCSQWSYLTRLELQKVLIVT